MKVITLKREHRRRIDFTFHVPGSKSYTNRALVMAALADGQTTLTGASPSRDSEAFISALKELGIRIDTPDQGTIKIFGTGGHFRPYRGTIDVGPAGTTMRFLTALCSTIKGADITLRGSERMHQRPIMSLVDALRQAGASIDYLGSSGCPPLAVRSDRKLHGGGLLIDGSTSSQFISALLLTSPLFEGGLDLSIEGNATSKSYIDMTLQGMREFGVSAVNQGYKRISVSAGQSYTAREYKVEGDASGASYLWALAAVSGGAVTVKNINTSSAQGDIGFPALLERMGCSVSYGDGAITVSGPGKLSAIEADMELMPDTAQTLAVVAAYAKGDTVIRGLKTLRVKETDRIAALHNELAKLGISSTAGPDYIIVRGGTPSKGARIATYEDHRMAMSFAVCAAATDDIKIAEPQVVDKSFPDFWNTLDLIGIRSEASEETL
jgi:3-phosphoshikimate 1-carboxyvinyltransferase